MKKENIDNAISVIKVLLENDVRFYLDNNIISGNINLIFHERHIDLAKNLFPDLLKVSSTSSKINCIGKIVLKGQKIDVTQFV